MQAAARDSVADAWCLLLEHFGTRTFAEVSAPARALAENGFPLEAFLRDTLLLLEEHFQKLWPTSAALYTSTPRIGTRMRNPAWGAVLGELAKAEKQSWGGREAGIRAARDAFYRGRAAEIIDTFVQAEAPDEDGRHDLGLLRGRRPGALQRAHRRRRLDRSDGCPDLEVRPLVSGPSVPAAHTAGRQDRLRRVAGG